ncbi:MAG: right-handed parallel beta-helix repeat-containing protein [Candidatus Hydrogenedentes bacterium]|nr:right-handed parallel beta-helix repeat-containing protein [Candidatus Hydrogenedentota bacterium]
MSSLKFDLRAAAIFLILCATTGLSFSAWSQPSQLEAPVVAESFPAIAPGTSLPPDTNGAVGPNHLLLATNGSVRIQDRSGNVISSITLLAFWQDLGVVDAFDPRSYYDPHSGRYIMITCGDRRSASSSLLLAVSANSDPTGIWHRWVLDADPANLSWLDYGNLGFTFDEITVTGNMFRVSDDTFTGVQFWRINKASALDGGALTRETFKVTNAGGTLVPVCTFDADVSTQYVVRTGSANLFSQGRIQLFTLGGILGASTFLAAPFAALGDPWSTSLPNAPQLGSTATIETNDDRLLSAVYRDGRIWACHNAGFPAGGAVRTGAKWWCLDPATGITEQQGALDDGAAQRSFYYPSLVVNNQGVMMLACSGSSPTEYVGAFYAWRTPSSLPGTLDGYQKFRAGAGPYTGPRWGDYSGIYPDPLNGASIWALQQYAEVSNRWGIQWAKLTISTSSPSPDTDGDGLDDAEEAARGTNPLVADTDGDGLDDGDEVTRTTNPLQSDTDGDGLSDGQEVGLGTNPLLADTDGDGIPDGTEVDGGTNPSSSASVLSSVYVDGASGSDSSGFGTQAHPWATIARAVAAVRGTAANTVSIRVAKGTYRHLRTGGGALMADSHEHLIGGYQAGAWTRDIQTHTTVLDASIAVSGGPAPNVVVLNGVVNVILDGFTVTGAYAPASGPANSAGILGVGLDSTTEIANCTVIGNTAGTNGSGGIRLIDASPVISSTTIAENYTDGEGGGLYAGGASAPLIERCVIGGNRGAGGGVFIGDAATALIANCVISGNDAGQMGGGGLSIGGGAGTVVSNTTIAHNDAGANGGGGVEVLAGTPVFVNCLFAGNRNYAVVDYANGTGLVMENCLFDGNSEGDYYQFVSGAPVIRNGATAINAGVVGASGNVDGPSDFTMPQGAWTAAVSYNATTGRSTLTDGAATFVPGALRGQLIALSADRTVQLLIQDNTSNAIEVRGDQSSWILSGQSYQLADYHLELDSTAIDAGLDTSGPADGAVVEDFDGTPRGFDGDGLGSVTGDGSNYDIGAFESDTPPILDTITVTRPNGGEVIPWATLQPITWNSRGDIGPNVKIVARKGSFSAVLSSITPNDGAYDWLVPMNFPAVSGLTVEISSLANPTILDSSDAPFTVVGTEPLAGTITVLSPNGGESILRNVSYPITWSTTGNIGGAVKIALRRGASVINVTSVTANNGRFDWMPGSPVASDYYIEITAVLAPAITDTSNGLFSLVNTLPSGTLTVTAPNGGESYLQGGVLPIAWTTTGTTGADVQILARSAGQTYTVATSTANDGSFNWTVPTAQAPGTDYNIEVRSVELPSIGDASNAAFTIAPPSTLTVTAPNGGESYEQGGVLPITWTTTGSTGADVQILARSAGQTYTVAASTANDGSFNWTVPTAQAPGTDYIIEVRSLSLPSIGDTSNAAFTIASPPSITVTAPNGGESYLQGGVLPIAWTTTGTTGADVQILARSAGQTYTVAASTANDGSFNWTVPTAQTPGTDYIIEVRSTSLPAIGDTSNAAFTILTAATITVTNPNGGESYFQGGVLPIAWNYTGAVGGSVKILARGAGQTFTVTPSTNNDNAFNWTIPSAQLAGADYTIEVSSVAFPAVLDSSNATFSITAPASITVTTPNGGESYLQGAVLPITWNSTGPAGDSVKIVARSAGQTYTVTSSTNNDGSFNWTVPSAQFPGTDYRIEVSSVAIPTLYDSSDANFTIATPPPMDSLTLLSPNGGEIIRRGTSHEIRWESTGNVGTTIKIVIRRGAYSGTLAGGTPNDGSYIWNIPATYGYGPGWTIEVISAATPTLFDASNATFTIEP